MSEPRVETLTRNEVLLGYESIKSTRPNLRARDVALELGISEAELLNSRTGDEITKLEGEWAELIRSLPSLGRVMVLTRNES